MADIERVAFVGLGIMGGPMARNLREAGFDLTVYTRTAEKAERFAAEHGARAAATPAEAAEGADGGEPGERGRNLLDGVQLEPKASGDLRAGQRLRIETPGGGGHGSA